MRTRENGEQLTGDCLSRCKLPLDFSVANCNKGVCLPLNEQQLHSNQRGSCRIALARHESRCGCHINVNVYSRFLGLSVFASSSNVVSAERPSSVWECVSLLCSAVQLPSLTAVENRVRFNFRLRSRQLSLRYDG